MSEEHKILLWWQGHTLPNEHAHRFHLAEIQLKMYTASKVREALDRIESAWMAADNAKLESINIGKEMDKIRAEIALHQPNNQGISKTIDWNHIETMQSNLDAASSALNMLHEEIEAIRK